MSASSRRGGSAIVVGIVVIVVGLVAAIAMWLVGENRRSDAIADLARAPVGCDTTLDFVETGEYLVFVENEGRLDEVRGDCDAAGEYAVGDDPPEVEISFVDPDGESIELDPIDSEIEYDEGGFAGSAVFRVDISEPSDHVIRVEAAGDAMFAAAVGRDPSDGVVALRIGALVAAAAGLLIGVALIVVGSQRRRSTGAGSASTPVSPWQPGAFSPGPPPQGPPVFGRPQGPPPYPGTPVPPPPPPPRPSPQPPPSPPAPPPPAPPRIPGEPRLPSTSGWSVDDDATTQERSPSDDRRSMPPPE